jgi:hypothetical protein
LTVWTTMGGPEAVSNSMPAATPASAIFAADLAPD